MKKEVVIFVPGSYDLTKWPTLIQEFISSIGHFFKFKPVSVDHVEIWKKKFKESIWMHWNRGISPMSKWFAKRKLKRILNHYKNENVKLVGISSGGDIILETIKSNSYNNVKRIVLVCSINGTKNIKFDHPEIFNIYSNKDKFAELAINLYAPIHGGERLYGSNVKNIEIPMIEHVDFCSDSKVKCGAYKGKRITELVSNLLK